MFILVRNTNRWKIFLRRNLSFFNNSKTRVPCKWPNLDFTHCFDKSDLVKRASFFRTFRVQLSRKSIDRVISRSLDATFRSANVVILTSRHYDGRLNIWSLVSNIGANSIITNDRPTIVVRLIFDSGWRYFRDKLYIKQSHDNIELINTLSMIILQERKFVFLFTENQCSVSIVYTIGYKEKKIENA